MLSQKFPIPSLALHSPTHPLPLLGPGVSPVLGHIIFPRPRVSPANDGQLGHLLLHMQLETWALGVLVSWYCSTYSIADPFSSLGTFSSSSIGGPVLHPIDDCEHPLLYLPGNDLASQEIAISGSFQQNHVGICHSVCVWWLIMGWMPVGTVSGWSILWSQLQILSL